MKKKIIKRGIIGIPLGIALGYVITIMISICSADGLYHAVEPQLVETMGNELNAIILQAVLCGIMGMGFAMASVIWEIDSWDIVKQSGIYFAIACFIMFPIAFFIHWMSHSIWGIISYVGIFISIFVFTWIFQYIVWKKKIVKINEEMSSKN